MLILFKRPWRIYQPGDETEQVPDGAARELIRRGVAEKRDKFGLKGPATVTVERAGRPVKTTKRKGRTNR